MRGPLVLIAALGMCVAPVAGQLAPGPHGDALHMTAVSLQAPGPGGMGTKVNAWGVYPGSPDEVPFPFSSPAGYNYLEFVHHVEEPFAFASDGMLRVPVHCRGSVLSAWPVQASLMLRGAEGVLALGSASDTMPVPCQDEVVQLRMPMVLRGLAVEEGEEVLVFINTYVPNVPANPSLALPVGHPDHPAGLFANATSGPRRLPLVVEDEWDDATYVSETHFFSTDSDGVVLRVDAAAEGDVVMASVRITHAFGGDQVFEQRWQGGDDGVLQVAHETTLPGGNGTRWVVEVQYRGDQGTIDVRLSPARIEVTEEVAPPVASGAPVPQSGTSVASPMPLALVAVGLALAVFLARRRTP